MWWGGKEAGRDDEDAQRDLDLVLEPLWSHGRSLSRRVTSYLPSNAATEGRGQKGLATGETKERHRGCPGRSWRDKGPAQGKHGDLPGLDGQLGKKCKLVPGFLLGQQDGP